MEQQKLYIIVLVGLLILSIIVLLVTNRRCKDDAEKYRNFGDKKLLTLPMGQTDNTEIKTWNTIIREIAKNYHNYDGFIVITNFDGITYLSNALSFMLENLGKSVAVTLPQHLKYTKQMLLKYSIPEVVLSTGNVLLRGCCCTTLSNTIISLYYPYLALKNKLYSERLLIYPKENFKPLLINENTTVIVVKLYPSMTGEHIRSLVIKGGVNGIILESYGYGKTPITKEFMTTLQKIIDQDIIVVQTSMDKLNVMEKTLEQVGVVCADKQTTETVYAKLSLIFSNIKTPKPELVKKLVNINMRGELQDLNT